MTQNTGTGLAQAGDDGLASRLAPLTAALLEARTVGEVLDRVCETTAVVIPGADVVSVTLRAPDGRFHTPTGTDEVAIALDLLQYEAGEGPCVNAARDGGPGHVHCADLALGEHWPVFGPAAAAAGFRAVLATALVVGGALSGYQGALNVYTRGVVDSRQACDIALILAAQASLALASVVTAEHTLLRETQLRAAIDSRDLIGQAKGILMQRRGITADEAFTVLREASQRMNVKLAEVAARLTGGG
ncbi:ANTAR domain-containing protein [Actinokineospora pegani]|uniref:ANTAR domain-containing protein n=1 Tax=Actinokineospora pegani TaxID=2654637 RepID=UPI0012EA349E|nr:ANTAR domain-containing protein [Actinokineospora pegani]